MVTIPPIKMVMTGVVQMTLFYQHYHFYNWKDPPFCSWVHQLFLWPFSIAIMLVHHSSSIYRRDNHGFLQRKRGLTITLYGQEEKVRFVDPTRGD